MRRRIIYPAIVLLGLLAPFHGAGAAVVEQLIAVVDGEPFTLSNINRYAKEKLKRGFPTGDLAQINSADREALEQFITDKLLEAEVREGGIVVSEEDVNGYIEQVKKTNRLSDDDLKAALSREGQTLASYRASVKTEMEKSEILDEIPQRRSNWRCSGFGPRATSVRSNDYSNSRSPNARFARVTIEKFV